MNVAMKLTRRNALIGMGTVAAGAGIIGGTGAFTSVDADRTVSVQTAGDGSAALQLSEADNAPAEDSDGNSYIVEGDDADTLSVNVPDLNVNAKTKINPLINIANNGGEEVGISVSFTDSSDSDISWMSAINTPSTISAGQNADFGLEFDTTSGGPDPDDGEQEYTMTISADINDT
jgi:hypothetical protein